MQPVLSQKNNIYYHDIPASVSVGQEIIISQLMFSSEPIVNGMLFFRDRGELSFQEVEMYYERGRWIGIIPSDRVTIQGIEYFTILSKPDGGKISLPFNMNPFENPISIDVSQNVSLENQSNLDNNNNIYNSETIEADILILSPEEGSINRPDEIVISISLFNAPNIDVNTFRVLIDGKDYTNETTIFEDVLSLVPSEQLDIGLHKVVITAKSTFGIDIVPLEWSFSATKGMKNLSESFIYGGSFNSKSF